MELAVKAGNPAVPLHIRTPFNEAWASLKIFLIRRSPFPVWRDQARVYTHGGAQASGFWSASGPTASSEVPGPGEPAGRVGTICAVL